MKALISSTEVFDYTWVTSWTKKKVNPFFPEDWVPETTETIKDCVRVVEVEPDNKIFEVYPSLFWVDCPDDCKADAWYYKDGQVNIKPVNADKPEN
jgi:hypothetical protein